MSELWLPVRGYEGLYEVSDRGRVRGVRREGVLQTHPDKNGYLRVRLSREGRVKNFVVHRLVCEAFHGPPPEGKKLALHGPLGVSVNTPGNLRWGTHQDSALDRGRDGTDAKSNQTACILGHEFTAENTYVRPNGTRACRTCHRIRSRGYYVESRTT